MHRTVLVSDGIQWAQKNTIIFAEEDVLGNETLHFVVDGEEQLVLGPTAAPILVTSPVGEIPVTITDVDMPSQTSRLQTNVIQLNQLPIATGNGAADSITEGVQRVALANDNPTLATDLQRIAGTDISVGTGAIDAGCQRIVLADETEVNVVNQQKNFFSTTLKTSGGSDDARGNFGAGEAFGFTATVDNTLITAFKIVFIGPYAAFPFAWGFSSYGDITAAGLAIQTVKSAVTTEIIDPRPNTNFALYQLGDVHFYECVGTSTAQLTFRLSFAHAPIKLDIGDRFEVVLFGNFEAVLPARLDSHHLAISGCTP